VSLVAGGSLALQALYATDAVKEAFALEHRPVQYEHNTMFPDDDSDDSDEE
jgi:hypothetical protein